jgi:hypothetical protein
MSTVSKVVFLFSVCFLFVAGLASAQSDMYAPDHEWTDQDFAQLAKPAAVPLPVGTEITTENWKPYQDYMTMGMRTVFRGDRFF